jgi:hypothetical protein
LICIIVAGISSLFFAVGGGKQNKTALPYLLHINPGTNLKKMDGDKFLWWEYRPKKVNKSIMGANKIRGIYAPRMFFPVSSWLRLKKSAGSQRRLTTRLFGWLGA